MIHFDSEKDMEDALYSNPQKLAEMLGLMGDWQLFRQVQLGSYGVCDLIFLAYEDQLSGLSHSYKTIRAHIVELKNTPIKTGHILQCAKYKSFFDSVSGIDNTYVETDVSLIGLDTDFAYSGDMVFLAQSIDWLEVHIMKMSIDGISLKKTEGWQKGDPAIEQLQAIINLMEAESGENQND